MIVPLPAFEYDRLPVHLRHEVVNDYHVNWVHACQLQSLASAWSGQNGVPEALQEQFLALQHVFVIVDAKKYVAQQFRISGYGHGFHLHELILNTQIEEAVQNCSKQCLL